MHFEKYSTFIHLKCSDAQTFQRKWLFSLFVLVLEEKMLLAETRLYIKHFYPGGNVISFIFICFPGKQTLNSNCLFF